MDVSEDESIGYYKVELPKVEAGPSNNVTLADLLNNFCNAEGNEVGSNSTLDEGLDFSYGADQIFEQTAVDLNENDEIAPARGNGENHNSDASEAAGGGNGRRREATFEETTVMMDKRQRRMIRNRASAQRSRARKQAYTIALETQLDQVREENEMLKLLVEEKREVPTKTQWVANKLKKLRRSISW